MKNKFNLEKNFVHVPNTEHYHILRIHSFIRNKTIFKRTKKQAERKNILLYKVTNSKIM